MRRYYAQTSRSPCIAHKIYKLQARARQSPDIRSVAAELPIQGCNHALPIVKYIAVV
jgi:hypothetical protein